MWWDEDGFAPPLMGAFHLRKMLERQGCSWHCTNTFICVISMHPPNNPSGCLLSSLDEGKEAQRGEVSCPSHRGSGRSRIQIQVCLAPKPLFLLGSEISYSKLHFPPQPCLKEPGGLPGRGGLTETCCQPLFRAPTQ